MFLTYVSVPVHAYICPCRRWTGATAGGLVHYYYVLLCCDALLVLYMHACERSKTDCLLGIELGASSQAGQCRDQSVCRNEINAGRPPFPCMVWNTSAPLLLHPSHSILMHAWCGSRKEKRHACIWEMEYVRGHDLDHQDDGDAFAFDTTRSMQANKQTDLSMSTIVSFQPEGKVSSGAYYALVGRFLSLSKLLKATHLLAYIYI